jgi:hypothetical protein
LSPVVLGQGEVMFAGIDLPALGYRVTEHQATEQPPTSFSADRRSTSTRSISPKRPEVRYWPETVAPTVRLRVRCWMSNCRAGSWAVRQFMTHQRHGCLEFLHRKLIC